MIRLFKAGKSTPCQGGPAEGFREAGMVKSQAKEREDRAEKAETAIRKIKVVLKQHKRPPLDKRKKLDRIKDILKRMPDRKQKLLEIKETRKALAELDELLAFAAECDKDEWEDVPEVRTKPPKLGSKMSLGRDRIFNGSRSSVSWYKDTRARIIKKNAKRHKGDIVCEDCEEVLELKEAQIDHIKDWARYQNNADLIYFCFDGWHFSGQLLDDIRAVYNDEDNLQVLCDSCNPSKSGKKGDDLNGPQPMHACPYGGSDECDWDKVE